MIVGDRRIYTTPFQKKLLSLVIRKDAGAGGHWLPDNTLRRGAVCVPGQGTHTVRRAMYAAFAEDLEAGVDLRAACGVKVCLRPSHQKKFPARSREGSRGLSVPDLVLCKNPPARRGPHVELNLPSGWSVGEVQTVLALKSQSSLEGAVAAIGRAGDAYQEIVRIWNGVYAPAIRAARDRKERREAATMADAPSAAVSATFDAELDLDEDSELAAWLSRVS